MYIITVNRGRPGLDMSRGENPQVWEATQTRLFNQASPTLIVEVRCKKEFLELDSGAVEPC